MQAPARSAVKTNKTEVNRQPLKTISLKAALSNNPPAPPSYAKPVQGKQVLTSKLFVDPTWNTVFTQEQLRDVWLKFGRGIEQKNPRFASIIAIHVPNIIEGNNIELSLKNVTQENEIKTNKALILQHIRHHLQNANVQLETKLVLDTSNQGKAYTAADKAKAMLKKNPMLLELTKRFNLDVE